MSAVRYNNLNGRIGIARPETETGVIGSAVKIPGGSNRHSRVLPRAHGGVP